MLQRRPAGLPTREVLGDVTDLDLVERRLPRPGRRAAPGRQGRRVRRLAGLRAGQRRRYRRDSGRLPGRRGAAAGQRVVAVGGARRRRPGRRRRGARRPATAPAATTRGPRRSPNVAALAADGPDLAVLSIRPHLVWGPGDTQLIARIVERARSGRLPLIGNGAALIDTTYVDNAADAMVAAVDAVGRVHGEALVVSNGEPRPVGEVLRRICAAAGVRGPAVGCRPGWPPPPARRSRRSGPPAASGGAAADPVPRRAAEHRALVRPAPHPGGPALDARGRDGRGLPPAGRVVRRLKPVSGVTLAAGE